MSEKDQPSVGQIFCVPLYEGGYAWGYVTLIDRQSGVLCSFFDLVSDTPDMPEGLHDLPLALEDLLVGGVEFQPSKRLGIMRWRLTQHHMLGPVRPTNSLFIMRSRPVYKIVDLAVERSGRPASEDEIQRYPVLGVFSPLFMTKLVEKAVRHLDIDPKLIGAGRGEASLH